LARRRDISRPTAQDALFADHAVGRHMPLLRRWLEQPGQTQDAETRGAVELTLLFALVGPLLLVGVAIETIQFDNVVVVLAVGFAVIAAVCAYSIRRTFRALRADRQYLTSAVADARAAEGRARADLKQLREAFDVLPEPLILFDADDRVVIWNKLYAKHSSLAPGHGDGTLRPGLTFTELMRANLAKGRFPAAAGREEEWLAERLALHTNAVNTYEQRLADDQWVRIEERRTPEGGNISVRIDITDLKQREASFRLLFDENPVPMFVFDHKTLQILAVNQTMIDHYGYSREQFLEMSIGDITPPEEFEAARASIATLGPKRPHTGKVWRHRKADGSEILIVSYSRGIEYKGYNARFAAIIDVTERVKADQELRETRAFLEQIIDNVPLSLTVKDVKDQRFVMMNRTSEEYWGVPRTEAIGKTVADLFGEERASQVGARDKAAIEAEGPVYLGDHKRIGRGDQDRIFTSHRVAVRDGDGKPIYVLGVMEDVTERRRAEERIEHLAHFDSLTDLPNRATFTSRLASTIEAADKADQAFALLFLDLDRFKEVNDVFGHGTGDKLLLEVAKRLNDAAEGAFVARLGGDEFTLIVEGPQPSSAEAVANRVLSLLSEEILVEDRSLRTGVSVGIALYPNDSTEASMLLANADAALYRAKAQGRGSIRFFEAEMDMQIRERRALQQDLQQALASGQMSLHYQPQTEVGGAITGFEVLLRWTHPTRGMVSPSTFIPLAEEGGTILELGEWVLREACREAASWQNPLQIAVNLSPAQFRRGDLPDLVHMVLLETGLSASRLILEVTEGVLIDDYNRALGILRRLKALGVRIAMDDFGTGYSSLSYLQAFPFDKIKIDRSFISSVETNAQSAAIVRAVIGLARGLDLPVVAEGVENKSQLEFLSRENCNEAQGYLIGKPQPIEHYADLVGGERARAVKSA
jgi:diguanylate cyclase (GGDEF)-like protein/PAS domain S-box-containing protein